MCEREVQRIENHESNTLFPLDKKVVYIYIYNAHTDFRLSSFILVQEI